LSQEKKEAEQHQSQFENELIRYLRMPDMLRNEICALLHEGCMRTVCFFEPFYKKGVGPCLKSIFLVIPTAIISAKTIFPNANNDVLLDKGLVPIKTHQGKAKILQNK
jgi:hypothetical protein